MLIERLTAEDALMLWPDALWPQDIGALVILDGSNLYDRDGRFRLDMVCQAVAARLHLVPRFRQLLHIPRPDLGGPLWIDAPEFDLNDHVGVNQLPAPADEAELLLAVEQVRRRRLDRSRPLWEMHFFTGMPEARVALFVRMHHAVADGMAGVATMARFLDIDRDAAPGRPEPSVPTATPPTEAQLRDDVRQRLRQRRRRVLSRLAHPMRTVRPLAAAWPAIRELVAQRPLPPTSLDRRVGPARRFVLIRSRLDLVKKVAHTYGATVNDVLLAVVAGGLRQLLRSRGEQADVLRVYVPISLHQRQSGEARGNLISQMVVALPVGASDSGLVLRQIAAETARSKARSHPSLGWMPHSGLAGRAFLRLVSRQRVNVTTADIPGPPMPLYFAGARLLEVFPLTQLIGKVSIGIAAMSYAGQFNLMVVADGDAYPDIDVFARSVEDELRALSMGAGVISARADESPRHELAEAGGR